MNENFMKKILNENMTLIERFCMQIFDDVMTR